MKATPNSAEKSKIIFVYTGSSKTSIDAGFLTLTHPKTGQPQKYILLDDILLELSLFKKKHSAWFNGNAVIADGALHMATPIDPLFMILPPATAQSKHTADPGHFMEAEELIRSEACPEMTQLLPLVAAHLPCICDVKEASGTRYFRFSRPRTLAWLRCKLRQTHAALAALRPCPLPPCAAAAEAYAAGLLCEYVSSDCANALLQFVQAPGDAPVLRAPTGTQLNAVGVEDGIAGVLPPVSKKAKIDVPLDPKQKAAASREASRKANFAKDAKGSASIGSFFKKKT